MWEANTIDISWLHIRTHGVSLSFVGKLVLETGLLVGKLQFSLSSLLLTLQLLLLVLPGARERRGRRGGCGVLMDA